MGEAFDALHDEAERQGLRVHLEHSGRRERSRLSRLAVVDRTGHEVGALRLGRRRDVETAARALLKLLIHRRRTSSRKV